MAALKRHRRILIALLCLLGCAPLLARTPARIDQRTYPVDLANTTDLRGALSAASPIREGGRVYHGYTRWFVRWHSFWRVNDGLCRMQRVSTEVDIEFTLPNATRQPRDRALRQRYTDFLNALRTHEQGHADFALQAAQQIEQALMAVPPQPDCDQLSAAANARGHAIIEHTRANERAYDDRTGHGRTQGAFLD
jgi:predicted secreted Zn-dependent protease